MAVSAVVLVAAASPATADSGLGFAADTADPSQSGYYNLSLAPGASAPSLGIRVVNTSPAPETLNIRPARGVTVQNTGDGYQVSPSGCEQSACWISGLPPTVALAPGQSQVVPFAVAVPAGAVAGQYLAGVAIQAAGLPPSVPVGPGNLHVNVVREVDVGVAVTVGSAAALNPGLQIPGATQRAGSGQPVAHLGEKNTGNAFLHPIGTFTLRVQDGTRRDFPVRSDTVLPGDTAGVDVAVGNLADGSYPASASLRYWDNPARVVNWSGNLVLGKVPNSLGHPQSAHQPGSPSSSSSSSSGFPLWAGIPLGAVVLGAGAIGGFFLANRRHRPAGTSGPTSTT